MPALHSSKSMKNSSSGIRVLRLAVSALVFLWLIATPKAALAQHGGGGGGGHAGGGGGHFGGGGGGEGHYGG
ncbi:MAG: hypothetical protein WAM08_16670, partial [Candidatus Acidiferrales bacterium]